MSKTDIDVLAELPVAAIEERMTAATARVQERIDRARAEQRDLTGRETGLCHQDRHELGALRDALELRAKNQARQEQFANAIDMATRQNGLSPLAPSQASLDRLEEARRTFASVSVIEQRAALATTSMGTATEYAANGLAAPRNLWRASGIPTTAPTGYAGVVPKFTLPSGVALVAEGTEHAEFDAVAPDAVTIGRAGAHSALSSEAGLSSSLAEISNAHARIIARDIDKAVITKIQSAAGALDVDEALVTVAAEAAVDPSQLWIVGDPVAIAGLAGQAQLAPANGTDIASYAVRYGGAQLYASPAATAGRLTVFDPQSFRAFASPLSSAVTVSPTDGSQTFGQWMFFGIGQALAGSAITVDVSDGS